MRAVWALCEDEMKTLKFDGEPVGDWRAHCPLSELLSQLCLAETGTCA